MSKAKAHFDKVANNYDLNCKKGIQAHFKSKETDIVLNRIMRTEPRSVIDIGCGSGFYSERIKRTLSSCKVQGLDFSENMVAVCKKKGLDAFVQDISKPIATKQKYEMALLLGVLEFCPDTSQLIANIAGLLEGPSEVLVLLPKRNIFNLPYQIYHWLNGKVFIRSRNWYRREFGKHFDLVDEKDLTTISYLMVFKKKRYE